MSVLPIRGKIMLANETEKVCNISNKYKFTFEKTEEEREMTNDPSNLVKKLYFIR